MDRRWGFSLFFRRKNSTKKKTTTTVRPKTDRQRKQGGGVSGDRQRWESHDCGAGNYNIKQRGCELLRSLSELGLWLAGVSSVRSHRSTEALSLKTYPAWSPIRAINNLQHPHTHHHHHHSLTLPPPHPHPPSSEATFTGMKPVSYFFRPPPTSLFIPVPDSFLLTTDDESSLMSTL